MRKFESDDERLVKCTITLMREFESDDESFENARDDLERSFEILTLRGGKTVLFCCN